jgi:hypothetical protein
MTTDDFLSAASDFNLLSLRDLLAARDQFHLPSHQHAACGRDSRRALSDSHDMPPPWRS